MAKTEVHETIRTLVLGLPQDKEWTAQKTAVAAITTWATTTESFNSQRGIVFVRVKPKTGSAYAGAITIYANEIPVSGSTFSFTDEGIVTEEIGVPNDEVIKVIVTAWSGTGTVDIDIRNA